MKNSATFQRKKQNPASTDLFKVSNGRRRTMYETCLRSTIKKLQRRTRHSGVLFLWTLNRFHTFTHWYVNRVRNVGFWENIAYVLYGWSPVQIQLVICNIYLGKKIISQIFYHYYWKSHFNHYNLRHIKKNSL